MNMTIFHPKSSAGLSMVELMVALTISAVLLLGVTTVYLSSRHSNAVQVEFSRMQENGRFSIHTLSKEVRMAGYLGCPNLASLKPNNIVMKNNAADTDFDFSFDTTVVGHTDCSGDTGAGCSPATPIGTLPVLSNTEALTIRRAASCSAVLSGNMGVDNANIMVSDDSCDFQTNDVLFISDCTHADIFRATTVSATGKVITHANNVNTTNRLSQAYNENARVMKWEQLTYFIGPCVNGITGCRSLFVNTEQGANSVTTELVEHVDDMQIEFHVDRDWNPLVDGNPNVDGYMTIAEVRNNNLWDKILAARIHLLTTTKNNTAKQNNNKDATPFRFMGLDQVSTDRRYRREFTTTINIRNRIR